MVTSTPRQGSGAALAAAAREHAEALRKQPGCRAAYVLSERGAPTVIALSVFDSEEQFNQGLEATRPIIAKHRIELLREGDSSFRTFDVQ